MATKKKTEAHAVDVEVTAGKRRLCPKCRLSFRHAELFDQHVALRCKPAKKKGPTWSTKTIEDAPNPAPQTPTTPETQPQS